MTDTLCASCAHTEACHKPASVNPWRPCQIPQCRCGGYARGLWCVTCDVSPRWAAFAQCFGCLYHRVPPAEVVPRQVVSVSALEAAAGFRRFRQQWEVRYPGWELVLDRERAWPETLATGHKRYSTQWRVERRHPRPTGEKEDPDSLWVILRQLSTVFGFSLEKAYG